MAVTTPVAALTSGGVAFRACSSALNGMKLIGEGRSASRFGSSAARERRRSETVSEMPLCQADRDAAIHRHRTSGHEGGAVAQEEESRLGDLFGRRHSLHRVQP